MACSDYSTATEMLKDLAFWDAIYCPWVDAVGELVLGLFVFGPLLLGSLVFFDSLAPVFVLAIVVGGVAAATLPGAAVQILILVIVLFVAGGIAALFRRLRTP